MTPARRLMTTRRQINAGLRRHRLYLAGVAFAGVSMAGPAGAQAVPCGDHDAMAGRLASQYGEAVTGRGITGGRMVELWHNPDTGTWTILIVRADGVACLPASGQSWSSVEPPPDGEAG